jgi:regulator of sirC expression with transglutaminase-like and TPR domain
MKMNALLLSEISAENSHPINTLALVEEYIFENKSTVAAQIDEIIIQCQHAIDGEEDILLQVESFLDCLFVHALFADNKRDLWSMRSFSPSTSLSFKVIAVPLKVIMIQYIAQSCGFDCDVVFVPDTLMMRIICSDEFSVIFDPITGEPINWQELDIRMNELDGDPSSQFLSGEKNQLLLINYLSALKNALIQAGLFQQALKCVDILLAIHPDDPIERRDRGFLLHQLDCFKVAYDDYRYFVEQCPQDPAAQLLKIQLDNIKIDQNVLH